MHTHTHTKQPDNLHFRSADAAAPLRSQCRRGQWTSCGLVLCQTAASTPKSWPLSGSEGPGDTDTVHSEDEFLTVITQSGTLAPLWAASVEVHAKGPWTDVADGDAVDKEVMDTVPHWDLTWAKPLLTMEN